MIVSDALFLILLQKNKPVFFYSMKSHSLKFLRIVVAVVLLLALTWLFVDFTGAAAVKLAWLAKIQLVPALLAVNVVQLPFLLF